MGRQRCGSGFRLVAYHHTGANRLIPSQPIRIALLIKATSCGSDAEAKTLIESIRSARIADEMGKDNLWHVAATMPDEKPDEKVELSAALDLVNGTPLTRQINGADVSPAIFRVNQSDQGYGAR